MDLWLAREAVAVGASAVAAYTDWKTGYIYDKLTYPLIGVGALFNLFEAPFDAWRFAPALAVFVLGYALYYAGKIGGGDVKLFTGLSLVIPQAGSLGLPFVVPVLLYASLAAMVWIGAYYSAKYARKGIDWKENRQGLGRGLLLGAVTAACLWFLMQTGRFSGLQVAGLGLPMAVAVVFVSFEQGIKRAFFLAHVKLGELEEDEVLAPEFLDEGLRKKLGQNFKGIVDKEEKRRLEALGVEAVPVYRNLPRFGPFILAGVLLALYQPGVFGWLTGLKP